uniref:Uncharacterized protein n=1 Tax=Anguilla anguilla TaxID=7936 RepID=A0A0E9TXI3_ANGAN
MAARNKTSAKTKLLKKRYFLQIYHLSRKHITSVVIYICVSCCFIKKMHPNGAMSLTQSRL